MDRLFLLIPDPHFTVAQSMVTGPAENCNHNIINFNMSKFVK